MISDNVLKKPIDNNQPKGRILKLLAQSKHTAICAFRLVQGNLWKEIIAE